MENVSTLEIYFIINGKEISTAAEMNAFFKKSMTAKNFLFTVKIGKPKPSEPPKPALIMNLEVPKYLIDS